MAVEPSWERRSSSPRSPDRRTSLLDAAVANIARKGVRGLRVEEVARSAGVSVALIYHYFPDRSALLKAALVRVAEQADRYTSFVTAESARDELIEVLMGEIQDDARVRDNSTAWGELRGSAIFNEGLREALDEHTRRWIDDIAEIVRRGYADGSIPRTVDAEDAGQRLTAIVEGLSGRWLSGVLTTEEAQDLLRAAVLKEVGRPAS